MSWLLVACAGGPIDESPPPGEQEGHDDAGEEEEGEEPDEASLDVDESIDGLVSLGDGDDTGVVEEAGPRRVLFVIADDLGIDAVGLYGDQDGDGEPDDGRSYPPTPTVDGICAQGVRFTRVWSFPTCSPARATMLTGRLPVRHGVMGALPDGFPGLGLDEPTLPRWLDSHPERDIAVANIGKWHVGNNEELGWDAAPNSLGWDHYAGLLSGGVSNYYDWRRTEDGKTMRSDVYATTAHVDDALAWLDTLEADADWLLWLAFTAPHDPFHVPPDELHTQGALGGPPEPTEDELEPWFFAMVEAMDTELGRLLQGLDDRGMEDVEIVFIGDNGTDSRVIAAPWSTERAKGTLYEGGIHVPMCIAGPSVAEPGRTTDAMVSAVDLYATIGGYFGLELEEHALPDFDYDSRSLHPLLADPGASWDRELLVSQSWGEAEVVADGVAIRGARFKLMRLDGEADELYDLEADPYEEEDLLAGEPDAEAEAAYVELSEALEAYLELAED